MMLDVEPQGYKFKHAQRISLDDYKGVANDLMELNNPVADGFMRVSDMRNDIVIIQKLQDRVRDYDEVGFVRVAKFLKMPRMDFWHRDGLVETRREDGVWLVAVNDQELADRVARSNDGKKKFDDLFVETFRGEVSRGLANCLKREKILNGGQYNAAFLTGYVTLGLDAYILPLVIATGVYSKSVSTTIAVGAYALANAMLVHLFGNGLNWSRTEKGTPLNTSSYNEPFIKHSLLENLLPPMPIDRLIRGAMYLNQHGHKIIQANSRSI